MLTRLYVVFFRRLRAANTDVSVGILPKFELIHLVGLVTCKNEGARVLSRFSPLSVYGNFFQTLKGGLLCSRGRIWLKSKLLRDIIDVLVTCKYEEDPIKNKSARELTRFFPIITQGELFVAMDTRAPIRSCSKP